MYQFTFNTHVIISILTLLAGGVSLFLAIRAYRKGDGYSAKIKIVSTIYLVALYLQFLLGLLMYYNHGGDKNLVENSPIQPGNSPTIRLWEIEHVAIMVFALFLVQIGYIFISKTKSPKRKFQLSFWYLGVPLILMVFTMAMAMR